MKLTPVAKALSVAATRLGMSASAQVQAIAMGVVVSPIQLAYEVGQWILRVNKLDPVGANDGAGVLGELFLAFFKSKTDNAAVAEQISLELHKTLRDEAGLTDTQIMDFFKGLADEAVVNESLALATAKPLNDGYSATDAAFAIFYKNLVDGAGFADDDVLSFFKVLTDTVPITDVATADFSKPVADAAGLVDVHSLGITKSFVDQLQVTDDIDGAASILDDENMQFFKQSTDVASLTDLFYRIVAFSRQFEDTATAYDSHAFGLAKALQDESAVSESVSKGLTRAPIEESFEITDLPSIGPGLVKTESASLTDSGSLRSQGYSDFSYFAEDYVGASRTF